MDRLTGRMQKVERLALRVIFFLIIFTGCATKEAVKSVPEEEILKERVTTYWNYKIHEEFDKSYEYELPLYRKKVSMVRYIKGINTTVLKWLGAKVDMITREDSSAIVDLTLRIQMRLPGLKDAGHDAMIKEKWVKVEGMWYHVPEGYAGS